MNTEDFWKGEGGDAYTKRCRVDWQARIPFWKMILDKTGARSVLEFGSNAGWNLSAISRCYPDVVVEGVEINVDAAYEAHVAGIKSQPNIMSCWRNHYELVFTAGVLIHIPPEELEKTMQKLIDKSLDYILAIEYYAEEETEIEYRGEMGLLWKRDYGKLYIDMGLELVEQGMAEGFDSCQYNLLRK